MTRPAWAASVVEQQVLIEFPAYALAAALAPVNDELRVQHEQLKAQRDTRRASLLTLSLPELETLRSQQAARVAQQKREREERAAAKAANKEAAKFYNQPQAVADFAHWGKLEYWTFDEALALLLGKSPQVLTSSAMRREMTSALSLLLPEHEPEKSDFVCAYEKLRHLAERATVMQGACLSPVKVLQWAHHSASIELPAPLLKAVVDHAKRTQPDPMPSPPPPVASEVPMAAGGTAPTNTDTPVVLKRAALVAQYDRSWPTIESDLNHANENGLSAKAKSERRGYWLEVEALQWARENGKLRDQVLYGKQGSNNPFGLSHRPEG